MYGVLIGIGRRLKLLILLLCITWLFIYFKLICFKKNFESLSDGRSSCEVAVSHLCKGHQQFPRDYRGSWATGLGGELSKISPREQPLPVQGVERALPQPAQPSPCLVVPVPGSLSAICYLGSCSLSDETRPPWVPWIHYYRHRKWSLLVILGFFRCGYHMQIEKIF